MGIKGVGAFLWTHKGCLIDVSIEDLKKKSKGNIIVVDGFNFYGWYVYPKIDWITCGNLNRLEEILGNFVSAFRRVGVELEFFFVNGCLDEGKEAAGSHTWAALHSEFVKYTKEFFREFWPPTSKGVHTKREQDQSLIKRRPYYYTPLDILPEMLFILSDILHCKIHYDFAGYRTLNTAYYARRKKAMALLAQDSFYIFYKGLPPYLQLKCLDLDTMTTKQCCPEAIAYHLKIEERHLYPIFFEEEINHKQRQLLIEIMAQLDDRDAMNKITSCLETEKLDVFNLTTDDAHEESDLVFTLLEEVIRYKLTSHTCPEFLKKREYGPLSKWEDIQRRCCALYLCGVLSGKIVYLMQSKMFFNNNILEDFKAPSSFVYQPLRKKIYGVLFAEYENVTRNNSSYDSCSEKTAENRDIQETFKEGNATLKVSEWCVTEDGCSDKPIEVEVNPIDQEFHDGLHTIWSNKENLTNKWKLFAHCVSHTLNYQQLCNLPPTLVLPTVVLYYLHRVPQTCTDIRKKVLEPWEINVLIAQAILTMEGKNFKVIKDVKEHVVKLTAFFIYGCQMMRLLVEVCGYPITQTHLQLWKFFNGNVFHTLYEKAEWRNADSLCQGDQQTLYQDIKHIIYGP